MWGYYTRGIMDKARIYVDFNELVARNIVLMSRDDTKVDSNGIMHESDLGKKPSCNEKGF